MKRFKKLVSVLTLTAMLAASLTACGGKDPVAEDDSTAGTTTADSSTATTEKHIYLCHLRGPHRDCQCYYNI